MVPDRRITRLLQDTFGNMAQTMSAFYACICNYYTNTARYGCINETPCRERVGNREEHHSTNDDSAYQILDMIITEVAITSIAMPCQKSCMTDWLLL
jgi:hypothetical protein